MTMARTDYTNAKRQKEAREREAAAGLKRVTLVVPISRAEELKAVAERLRQEEGAAA